MIAIKVYGVSEFSRVYQISPKTLKRWFRDINIPLPRYTKLLHPAQVKRFIEEYGEPETD